MNLELEPLDRIFANPQFSELRKVQVDCSTWYADRVEDAETVIRRKLPLCHERGILEVVVPTA